MWQLASFLLVPTTVLTRVVWPCLGDGNKLRQLFTNLLSSSLFSPLQDHSLFEQYMPQNWMCHICWKCPPEKPSFPLFGWKGERGHATLFSFQPSPARLIKPGFHKKNWEFWRRGSSWCVSERKAAGWILSASSHWFSRVGVNQTQPLQCTAEKIKLNHWADSEKKTVLTWKNKTLLTRRNQTVLTLKLPRLCSLCLSSFSLSSSTQYS